MNLQSLGGRKFEHIAVKVRMRNQLPDLTGLTMGLTTRPNPHGNDSKHIYGPCELKHVLWAQL